MITCCTGGKLKVREGVTEQDTVRGLEMHTEAGVLHAGMFSHRHDLQKTNTQLQCDRRKRKTALYHNWLRRFYSTPPVLQTCCILLLLLVMRSSSSKQNSQGSSRWPRYHLTMKTVQLNPIGFIWFHFQQDGLGRPSHTHPVQQQGLISRETRLHQRRQMNFNYCWSRAVFFLFFCSCTRTFQSANSRGTHYYVNAVYCMFRADIWCLSSDLLISQQHTPPSSTQQRMWEWW